MLQFKYKATITTIKGDLDVEDTVVASNYRRALAKITEIHGERCFLRSIQALNI